MSKSNTECSGNQPNVPAKNQIFCLTTVNCIWIIQNESKIWLSRVQKTLSSVFFPPKCRIFGDKQIFCYIPIPQNVTETIRAEYSVNFRPEYSARKSYRWNTTQRANSDNTYWEKGILSCPKYDGTRGFKCRGHSDWTIYSHISPFFPDNFSYVSPIYWEANSYYPQNAIHAVCFIRDRL